MEELNLPEKAAVLYQQGREKSAAAAVSLRAAASHAAERAGFPAVAARIATGELLALTVPGLIKPVAAVITDSPEIWMSDASTWHIQEHCILHRRRHGRRCPRRGRPWLHAGGCCC